MKIFFSILLSVCFLKSFAQKDSIANKYTIGMAPLNSIYAPYTDWRYFGDELYFEYQKKQSISYEIGFGLYQPVPSKWNYTNMSGFIIRSGVRFYRESEKKAKPYFEVYGFYRQLRYIDRVYRNNADQIAETTIIFGNGGGDYENATKEIANELKHVICIAGFLGEKYTLGRRKHFVFDYCVGLGVRLKYRVLSVTQEHISSPNYLSPVNPPRKEIITSIFPSLPFGFKIGYAF